MRKVYIKPATMLVNSQYESHLCAGSGSGVYGNWGDSSGNYHDEGHEPKPDNPGVDVDDNDGEIDSRAKQNTWNVWNTWDD